ncbi:hypothetical protein BDW59DRAFT_140251 [Aspergillus cavernicola]|uniref:Uncharacterized protein n=1 Tax=Aspergillus cavernicola TaxID=176166 RepID=A0ABR4IV98_9EURO
MPSLSACLTLAIGLLPATMAQICTPEFGTQGYAYDVSSPSVLDQIVAEGCTTINGSIVITSNFTGPFYLPNVRNITDGLRWRYDTRIGPVVPTPTSIDLPDLEFIGDDLAIYSLPTLANVSMPNLKTAVHGFNMYFVRDVNLRSLETVGYLYILGNLSSLRLDSLRYVSDKLWICNKDECDQEKSPVSAFDFSLPSLETVGTVDLEGSLSSLEVSNLRNVSEFSLVSGGGPALNLDFPRLTVVSGAQLDGDIASLSMPGVKNMTGILNVRTYVPLDINLPFQEAEGIILYGNISSVQFPNLTSIPQDLFSVDSTLPVDCDALEKTLSQATNMTITHIRCSSSKESHSGLSVGAKAAIGVVVGVVGLVIIAGILFLLKRRRRREHLKMESSVHLNDSLPPTYNEVRNDPARLPEYSPPALGR